MNKNPAFLFYVKDFLEGTQEMTYEETGIYIKLLCHQWERGIIPKEEDRLIRLLKLSKEQFDPIWIYVKEKFIELDDGLINERLEKERDARNKFKNYASLKGIIGAFYKTNCKILKKKELDEFKILVNKINLNETQKETLKGTLDNLLKGYLSNNEDANANANENNLKDNKEDKDKDKKCFKIPTPKEIINYGIERGYKLDGQKIFDYYNDNEWKDSKGNVVKSWKQKILSVWCQEENKIKQEPKKLKLNEIDDNIHYWVKFKGIQKYKNIGFGIKKEATDNELEYIETI